MSSYILIANAPCTVFVSGSSYAVQFAGERLILQKDEAMQIMHGPYGNRFQCIAPDDSGVVAQPLAQQVADGNSPLVKVSNGVEEQLYKGSPIGSSQPDGYTPRPANSPMADDSFAKEAEEEAAKIMQSIAPKAKKVKSEASVEVTEPDLSPPPPAAAPKFQVKPPPAEQAPETGQDSLDDDEVKYTSVLPEDSHFKTIISYLNDKERDNDPNLKDIAAEIKRRFPTYKSVITECNRILG